MHRAAHLQQAVDDTCIARDALRPVHFDVLAALHLGLWCKVGSIKDAKMSNCMITEGSSCCKAADGSMSVAGQRMYRGQQCIEQDYLSLQCKVGSAK